MGYYIKTNEDAFDALPVEWRGDDDDLTPAVTADDAFAYDEAFAGVEQGDGEDNTLHYGENGLRVFIGKASAIRAAIEYVKDLADEANDSEKIIATNNLDRLKRELKEYMKASKPVKRASQVAKLED